jgi:hypothetical protein
MPRRARSHRRRDCGQAAVELLAAVPFVLLVGAVAWQLALAGWTAWMTAHAARVAARADAVGRPVRAAARSALPGPMRPGLEVDRPGSGGVRVRARVPLLLGRSGPVVSSTASLGRHR